MGLQRTLMNAFAKGHVPAYRASKGRVGGRMGGLDVLLLTTTGRKSGLERTNPLAYLVEGESLIVAASAAGLDRHPAWFHNLVANPDVTVQVGADINPRTARVLEGDERNIAYATFEQDFPQYATYREATDRVIPIVSFDPR